MKEVEYKDDTKTKAINKKPRIAVGEKAWAKAIAEFKEKLKAKKEAKQ